MLGINLLLFTFGSAVCALAPGYAVLAIGRAIVGFGLGGEISLAVTMLSEFCSSWFRGTAVGLVNVGVGRMSNFLATAFGLLVHYFFPGPDGWRRLFGILAVPALLIVFYRRFIPETPRYLFSASKIDEANRVLSILASGRLAQGDLGCIRTSRGMGRCLRRRRLGVRSFPRSSAGRSRGGPSPSQLPSG